MTAEIAIINKSAVALAADSKVTLTIGAQQKTYDTVNKLFSLSKTEPVGAMVYGNAEFMQFPWETILKEYRRRGPHRKFDTIFAWADDLIAFLTTFFPFTDEDEDALVGRSSSTAIEHIVSRFVAFARGQVLESGLKAEFDLHIAKLNELPDFFSAGTWNDLLPRLAPIFDRVSAAGIGAAAPGLQPVLRAYAELLIKKTTLSPASSGLVVAGFGEKELLPSLFAVEIEGIVGGKIKGIERARVDATRKTQGVICPFAQSDMVYRFMEGIDGELEEQIRGGVGELLLRNARETASALGHPKEQIDALMPAFATARDAALNEFWSQAKKLRGNRFAQPIVEMTASLPKDELAHLAESLVSLTSLQRRVSREIETVGGAVDVAVISKGDGFVWIKRKHYFSADRNLRFVNGYFSEYEQRGRGDQNDDGGVNDDRS